MDNKHKGDVQKEPENRANQSPVLIRRGLEEYLRRIY